MTFQFALHRIFLALAAGSFAVSALAQWQWIDQDGRKVYSDQSPPANIRDKDILKRPGGRTPMPAVISDSIGQPPAAARASSAPSSSPKVSGQEAELEARKKQTEKEEALKKQADQDKQAKVREENCNRARMALTTLQSGIRMGVTNASGEREVMDDTKRAEETKRAKDVANTNCTR